MKERNTLNSIKTKYLTPSFINIIIDLNDFFPFPISSCEIKVGKRSLVVSVHCVKLLREPVSSASLHRLPNGSISTRTVKLHYTKKWVTLPWWFVPFLFGHTPVGWWTTGSPRVTAQLAAVVWGTWGYAETLCVVVGDPSLCPAGLKRKGTLCSCSHQAIL